ncbi:DUF6671 family protein [Gordonia sp. AC31]|uniref:DUF6671 family protein n=1 Tax=Gordonia TaxID=2053 RepID=UPI002880C8FB|nr:DUF6671 family protein [Gordonia sp. AC31]MDT0224029.1 hypothetical protein [Gordonia sp. AC31]
MTTSAQQRQPAPPPPRTFPSPATLDHPYRAARIAVGTAHGKHRQLAGAFADTFGATLVVPTGLDTDQFGTFSGEVTRHLTAQDAAVAKAQLAMTITGIPLAIASEATYGNLYGFIPVHEEILVFCDHTRGIQLTETTRTTLTPGPPRPITQPDDALPAAATFGFPQQGAVVFSRPPQPPRIFGKGITDPATLHATATDALTLAHATPLYIGPDLRAHHNPTRQVTLTEVAHTLATRLATLCPRCRCPGYGTIATQLGLPCRECNTPTDQPHADIHGCPRCSHRHTVPRSPHRADPGACPTCNP